MASRSLGTLTLDLVARVGGFEQSMQKASRTTQQQMDHIAKGVGVAANAIVGLGTVTAGALADRDGLTWRSQGDTTSSHIWPVEVFRFQTDKPSRRS